MNKLKSFFAGFFIAVGVILTCCILAWLFTRCQSFNQTPIQTVSVTPEVEPAVILKAPPVIVSEYPKVEPELPKEFMGPAITITNESQMLNEIQVQDQLLIWLNQLDK